MLSARLLSTALLLSTAFASFAHAEAQRSAASINANRALVFQGRIIRPNGAFPNAKMAVTVKVYSPEPSSCLLWAEKQFVTVVNGSFSAEVGHSVNRLSNAEGGAAGDWRQVFINNPSFVITGASCALGASYTPGTSDDRIMSAIFMDGTIPIEVASLPIKSVPYALQAEEIGGFGLANLAKISGSGSNVTYTPNEIVSLKDLLGADTQWNMKARRVTNLADPVDPTDAATKQWVLANAGGGGGGGGGSGTVTSVSVSGAPLGITNGSSTPQISITQASGASAGYLTSVDWNTFNNKQPAGAYLTSIVGQNLADGLAWMGNSSGQATARLLRISDIRSVSGGGTSAFLNAGTCPAGQSLQYISANDKLECAAYSITAAQVAAGVAPTAGDAHKVYAVNAAGNGMEFKTISAGAGVTVTPSAGGISISATGSGGTITALTGEVTASGTGSVAATIAAGAVTTAKLNDKAVTFAKIQDVATTTLAGRSTAGTGSLEQISVGTGLQLSAGVLSATNSGTVQNISVAGLPLSVGGSSASPQLSIAQANTTTAGYLSAADWNTFSGKQAAITPTAGDANKIYGANAAGNGNEFKALTGAGSVSISHSAGGITITGAMGGGGTVTNVSGTGPISVSAGTSTPLVSIAQATTATDGYLSSADWNTFSGKQPAGNYITSLTGEVTASGAGAAAATIAAGAVTTAKLADANVTTVKIADANVTTAKLNDKAVTLAKVQDIATNSLIGRSTAATGVPEVITVGSGLTLSGGTLTATGSGGTVTSVGGTGPISVSNGSTTPTVSIALATTSTNGYLSSSDWNTFSGKQDAITTLAIGKGGTGVAPAGVVGDANKVFGLNSAGAAGEMKSLVQGSGVSITHGAGTITIAATGSGGTVTSVGVGGLPLSVSNATSTPTVSIAQANTSTAGYLSAADWNTFNDKQPAGSYLTAVPDNSVTSSKIVNGAVAYADLNLTASTVTNAGVLVHDGTNFASKTCGANETLIWSVANGWGCGSPSVTETDPKIGANTTNMLSKWNGSALVSSGVHESSGSVGIGTSSPNAPLHIASAATALDILRIQNTSSNGYSSIGFFDSANSQKGSFGYANSGTGDNYAGKVFFNGTGTDVVFGNAGNINLKIEAGGNVGIGNSSPGSTLDVKGTMRLSGSSSGYVGFAPAASAGSTTYTLPSSDGSAGHVLSTSGAGVLSWVVPGAGANQVLEAKTANYTITTADRQKFFAVSNATTMNLPSAATAGSGFMVTIKRIGTSDVSIAPNGSESIDGIAAVHALKTRYSTVQLMSDGANWLVINTTGKLQVPLITTSGALAFGDSSSARNCKAYLDSTHFDSAVNGNGLYWIDPDGAGGAAAYKAYCDMTTSGGGWTLIVTAFSNGGWNSTTIQSRNSTTPTIAGDYSILNQADTIRTITGSTFQYRIDAGSFGAYGGVWTAPSSYSFTSTSNANTAITLSIQYNSWSYNDSGVEQRMPYVCSTSMAILSTSASCTSSWWGTIASADASYDPSPWMSPEAPNPGTIWYWVR